jgi:hypothetical protein
MAWAGRGGLSGSRARGGASGCRRCVRGGMAKIPPRFTRSLAWLHCPSSTPRLGPSNLPRKSRHHSQTFPITSCSRTRSHQSSPPVRGLHSRRPASRRIPDICGLSLRHSPRSRRLSKSVGSAAQRAADSSGRDARPSCVAAGGNHLSRRSEDKIAFEERVDAPALPQTHRVARYPGNACSRRSRFLRYRYRRVRSPAFTCCPRRANTYT